MLGLGTAPGAISTTPQRVINSACFQAGPGNTGRAGTHRLSMQAVGERGVLSRKDAVSKSIRVPDAPITLSTASVYPEKVPSAFEMAAWLGYDGIEVMVALDAASQDLNVLRRLSDYHQM